MGIRTLRFLIFFKLRIAPQARNGILRELQRMNINCTTLLPGLDGFGRSLGTAVTIGSEWTTFGWDIDPRI